MTIADTREKCKAFLAKIPRDTLVLSIIVLASLCSFGFGYMAGLDEGQGSDQSPVVVPAAEGKIVASRSGTKYYLPSCAGVEKISESNRVWFATTEDARAAGYSPALNCKGL